MYISYPRRQNILGKEYREPSLNVTKTISVPVCPSRLPHSLVQSIEKASLARDISLDVNELIRLDKNNGRCSTSMTADCAKTKQGLECSIESSIMEGTDISAFSNFTYTSALSGEFKLMDISKEKMFEESVSKDTA